MCWTAAVRYGERQRPEHRSGGLLINAQVADAPRTVPEIAPLYSTRNRKLIKWNAAIVGICPAVIKQFLLFDYRRDFRFHAVSKSEL